MASTERRETKPLLSAEFSGEDEEYGIQGSVQEYTKDYEGDTRLWGCLPIDCLPHRFQDFLRKQLTSNNGFVLLLIISVIVLGTVNRVLYKIQVTDRTMKPYAIFVTDVLAVGYVITYGSIVIVRYWMGLIPRDMIYKNKFPWIDYRFILMGLMDATRQIFSIYSAREISGFLLTLLNQGVLPMTMIIAFFVMKTRYNWGQILGAVILIVGVVVTLIPDMTSGDDSNAIWSVIYFVSSLPAAISLVLKEMVFDQRKDMDTFTVNAMDSLFQLIFTILFLPLVMIPGFGAIEFSEFTNYINEAAHCLIGKSLDESLSTCDGMPWATLLYVIVNVSWNALFLLLVKKGGAVLSFIAVAVSLPLANLAFILDWPLLPGSGFQIPEGPLDLVALAVVLTGLITYRVFAILQKKKQEREKAEHESQSLITVGEESESTKR